MSVEQLLALAQSPLGKALGALVLGLTGTLARYRQTGRVPLSGLPWRALRRTLYAVRRRWFTVSKPDRDPVVLDTTIEDLHDMLAEKSYNPGWPLSYRYYGEDLNARRYYFDATRPHPHRQLHIRGFQTDDGVEVHAHEEPAPEHHPRAHLKELDMHPATDWVETAWTNTDFDPRTFPATTSNPI
ncbi:hypothetical protein [Halorussus salinus]|uniref:hypothetical protein n=1 Tax=Halorussus salinus TaxID=1364935 RepID=UPI001092C1D4|nr:hypothetical protein [Halorussus salinus]